jgi:hypothetical protein
MLANFVFVSPKLADRADEALAGEQVTLAAAAVLEKKSKAGLFPSVLPAGYIDPFNGKPLGYIHRGTAGFEIYSVGETGTFRGAIPLGRAEEWHVYPAAPKVSISSRSRR